MKHFSVRLIIAVLTFIIGVSATFVWFYRRNVPPKSQIAKVEQPTASPTSLGPCYFTRTENKKLEASEAVQLAECFIIQNGYTDLPPVDDKSKLMPESVEPGTDEQGMKMRRNSLERQAYGYAKGHRNPDDWIIVFRRKYKSEYAKVVPEYEESLKTLGRAVTMDAYGNNIRVEHQDIYLNFPKLVKINR